MLTYRQRDARRAIMLSASHGNFVRDRSCLCLRGVRRARGGATDRLWSHGRFAQPASRPGYGERSLLFRNAMLELLWVESAEEAQGDNVRRLGLWERWS